MKSLLLVALLAWTSTNAFAQALEGKALVDSLTGALAIAQDDTGKVRLLNELAWETAGDPTHDTRGYAEQALELATRLNDSYGISTSNFNIGQHYRRQGMYAQALERYYETLRIDETHGNKKGMNSVLLSIGSLHMTMTDYDKAEESFQHALALARELKAEEREASALSNLGMVENYRMNYATSIEYLSKALPILEKSGQTLNIAATLLSLGNAHRGTGNSAKALENYYAASGLFRQTGNAFGYIFALTNAAETYVRLNDSTSTNLPDSLRDKAALLVRAERLTRECIDVSQQTESIDNLNWSYLLLSRVLERRGDAGGAFAAFKQHILFRDSVHSQENRDKIEALSRQREEDLKQKQIELQQVRIAKAEQERWFIIVGVLLLAALGAVLFNRYRLQQRARRQLEMERVRSRISRDLHDDIGSTLSSINMFAHSAKKRLSERDIDNTSESLEKISDQAQRLLDDMSDIVWNIKPQNDALGEVLSRMREYASGMFDARQMDYTMDFPKHVDAMRLPLEVKNNLYLVFKEAVNNAVKHSGASHIDIRLTVENRNLKLTITDNGKGCDVNGNGSGNGLHNMKRRAEEVGGTLIIDGDNGSGTAVSFFVFLPTTWDTAAAVRV